MAIDLVTQDLTPIVPDGENPVMIRRAFQRINAIIDRLRSTVGALEAISVLPASVQRGSLVTGQGATPEWAALALGSAGKSLLSDGTDALWGLVSLVSGVTGTLAVSNGGTGATNAEDARVSLGVGLRASVTSQFDKTDTTLTAITGLSVQLEAGKSYAFRIVLFYNATVTGGHKYSLYGTATATSVVYGITSTEVTPSLVVTTRQTALDNTTGVGDAGPTSGMTILEGLIVVNAAGTLTPMFAQNTASGTSSILAGSHMIATPI